MIDDLDLLEKIRENGASTDASDMKASKSQDARPIPWRGKRKFLFSVLVLEGPRYMLRAVRMTLGYMWQKIIIGIWDGERMRCRATHLMWRIGKVMVLPVDLFVVFHHRADGGWVRCWMDRSRKIHT